MTSLPERTDATEMHAAAPARLRGLDGLRGLGCLTVLATHVLGRYNPDLVERLPVGALGYPAVILFFVLSGVLLYLPYARALLDGRPAPSTRSFAVRRAMRVLPGYLVVFLVCCFVLRAVFVENAAVADETFGDRGTGMMTDPVDLLANLTLVHSLFPSTLQTGISPTWTLSVEIGFYLALPLCALLAFRLRGRLSPVLCVLVPAAALVALGAAGKLLGHLLLAHTDEPDYVLREWGESWHAVVSRSFLSIADAFACGMVVVVVFLLLERGRVPERWARRTRGISIGLLLVCGVASLVPMALGWRVTSSVIALSMAGLVLATVAPLARGRRSALAEVLEWRPIRYVGLISLSIYLWHYPVLIVLGRWDLTGGDTTPGAVWNLALVAAVTVALSAVTYRYVEVPAQLLARRTRPRSAG